MRGNSIRTEPDRSLGEKSNTQMRGTTQAAALQQSWSGRVLNPGQQHRSCRERAAGDAVLGLEMVGTFLPFLSDSTRMGKVPSLWAGNSRREFSQGKAAASQWKSRWGPRGHEDGEVPSLGSSEW